MKRGIQEAEIEWFYDQKGITCEKGQTVNHKFRAYLENNNHIEFNSRLNPVWINLETTETPLAFHSPLRRIVLSDEKTPLKFDEKPYHKFNFTSCDMSYAKGINKNFQNTIFDNSIIDFSNFKESNFTKASFKSARLNYCSFSLTNLESCDFSDAFIIKVLFSKRIELTKGDEIIQLIHKGSNLNNAQFNNADVQSLDFQSSSLINTNFESSRLKNNLFHNTNLYGSIFDSAEIEECLFSSLMTGNISMKNSIVKNCRFQSSNFQAAQFDHTHFENVYFNDLVFISTSFINCTFKNCNFSHTTIFEDSNFSGSTFQNCCIYIENNFFEFSQFENVLLQECTFGSTHNQYSKSCIDSGSIINPKYVTLASFIKIQENIQEYLQHTA